MKLMNKFRRKSKHHSILESISRSMKLSLSNIWRNKFLTIATVLVMGILIFIFNIIIGIDFVTKSALNDLTQKIDIVVYLKDDVEYFQIQQLTSELQNLNGVTNVAYTSKKEALEMIAATHPKTADFLSQYGIENPLPPSLNITTERPELHSMVKQFLNQEKYRPLLANIITETDNQNNATNAVTRNLVSLSNTTNQIIFWVFIVFIIGTVLIISNAIQLTIYNRQREIYIMRLVGATRGFISLPFLFEGMIYGILSMVIATILILLLATQVQVAQVSISEYLNELPYIAIFFVELAAAMSLGVLCSFIAVFRYLRSKLTHS
ncbi:ABC transporter permease [Patescibacteria group bacterium]|nr:ABC transporter permease [Patescibacteria group bacterium]